MKFRGNLLPYLEECLAAINYAALCLNISDQPEARVDYFEKVNQISEKVVKSKVAIVSAIASEKCEKIFKTITAGKEVVHVSLNSLLSHHLIIEHCLNEQLPFTFNTSCLMEHTSSLFKALKENGYLIKAVYLSSEESGIAKGFVDNCFPFVDEIAFYHENEEELPKLGYKWIRHNETRGSGQMHHVSTYNKIKETFDASLKRDGSARSWESIFQAYPHSIEFITGAGLP